MSGMGPAANILIEGASHHRQHIEKAVISYIYKIQIFMD
jgi:hypothetical protein